METFLLGIASDYLAKFIVGFKKDQVTANLLMGKGEITNVHLDVSEINALLPGPICFKSISVRTLMINVQSFTNIKVAPIKIVVRGAEAVVVERMEVKGDSSTSSSTGGLGGPHKYGLIDRVLDNISLELQDIKVAISTFGRFKTHFVGAHTPPTLHLHLPSFVFYSVDEFGEPLKEKWPKVDGKIAVYKQIAVIVKVELAKRLVTGLETLTLLADTPCEVNLSMVKKVSTAQLLSLNCELSMENVEVLLASSNIMKYLIEFCYGIGFCMIKDRSFKDPLASLVSTSGEETTKMPLIENREKEPTTQVVSSYSSLEQSSEVNDVDDAGESIEESTLQNIAEDRSEKTSEIVAENSNYFEDWFSRTSTNTKSTSANKEQAVETGIEVSFSVCVQNLTFRLYLDKSKHFNFSLRTLEVCMSLPSVPLSFSLAFCHILYRSGHDIAVPLLLIPDVPATMLTSEGGTSPVIGLNIVKCETKEGYVITGNIQYCTITLDLGIILELVLFLDDCVDDRWMTGDWISELPLKLKSHLPYIQPRTVPPNDQNSISIQAIKEVNFEVDNIHVCVPKDMNKFVTSISGSFVYLDGNISNDSIEPRDLNLTVVLDATVESPSFSKHHILSPFMIHIKTTAMEDVSTLISIVSRNDLNLMLDEKSLSKCITIFQAQYDLANKVPLENSFLDTSKLINVLFGGAHKVNAVVNISRAHVMISFPDIGNEGILIENICISKTGHGSGFVTIGDVKIGSSVVSAIKGIKLHLAHNSTLELKGNIDSCTFYLEKISKILKFEALVGCHEFSADEINILASTTCFKKISSSICARFCLRSKTDGTIIQMPLDLNDIFVDYAQMSSFIRNMRECLAQHKEEAVANLSIAEELTERMMLLQSSSESVVDDLSSYLRLSHGENVSLRKQLLYLQNDRLSSLLFKSNEWSGYVQVNVARESHLQRFFLVAYRGVLYFYKTCGSQSEEGPYKVYPCSKHILFGTAAQTPRGLVLKSVNNKKRFLVIVTPSVKEYYKLMEVLRRSILIADLLAGHPMEEDYRNGEESGIDGDDKVTNETFKSEAQQKPLRSIGTKLDDFASGINKIGPRRGQKENPKPPVVSESSRDKHDESQKSSRNIGAKLDGFASGMNKFGARLRKGINDINQNAQMVDNHKSIEEYSSPTPTNEKEIEKTPAKTNADSSFKNEDVCTTYKTAVNSTSDSNSDRFKSRFKDAAQKAKNNMKKPFAFEQKGNEGAERVMPESNSLSIASPALESTNHGSSSLQSKFVGAAKIPKVNIRLPKSKAEDNSLDGNSINFGNKLSRMARTANEKVKNLSRSANNASSKDDDGFYVNKINPPKDEINLNFAVRLRSIKIRALHPDELQSASVTFPKPEELSQCIGNYYVRECKVISSKEEISTNSPKPTLTDASDNPIMDSSPGDTKKEKVLLVQTLDNDVTSTFKFILNIRKVDKNSSAEKVIERDLDQVCAIHASMCSAIDEIFEYYVWMLSNNRKKLDESTLDLVKSIIRDEPSITPIGVSLCSQARLVGRLLKGLLNVIPIVRSASFLDVVGGALCDYFSILLQIRLPKKMYNDLIKFLDISDVILVSSNDSSSIKFNESDRACDAYYVKMKGLLSNISSQISSIHSLSSSLRTINTNKEKINENEEKKNSADATHSHLMNALQKAMLERDESHAQIVATSVLHVHDLEQERKKTQRFTDKLNIVLKRLFDTEAAANASYFQSNVDILESLRIKQQQELKSLESELLENNDTELLSLCRQLASEIKARTSSTLEVNRLKELHNHETKIIKDENEKLRRELDMAKEALKRQQEEVQIARADQISWKSAFDDLSKKNLIMNCD